MRKSLSLLLAIAMVFSMFSSLAFAADTEMTVQEKYDALEAKGIFAGINGDDALDQPMNRAQFARVAALILGLPGIGTPDTKEVTVTPFTDVELGTWYIEEITAAKEASIFVGNGDGTFNPKGDITVQELAVVVVGLLGLEEVEGAAVEGAADWAAGFVQAIINAGVDFPTNYTEAAVRADLASLAFQADAVINPVVVVAPTVALDVASAVALNSKVVQVTLGTAATAADVAAATVTVKDGADAAVAVSSAMLAPYDTAGKTVLVTLGADTTVGTLYTLTVGEKSASFGGTTVDTAKPTVSTITVDDYNKVTVTFSEPIVLTGAAITGAEKYGTQTALEITGLAYSGNNKITFATADQKAATLYGLNISGVTDFAGNTMAADTAKTFVGTAKNTATNTITSITAIDSTTVDVLYAVKIDATTSVDAANYSVAMKYGAATAVAVTSAALKANTENTVRLTLATDTTAATLYEVTVKAGVTTKYGVATTAALTSTFVGIAKDTTVLAAPTTTSTSNTKITLDFGTAPADNVLSTTTAAQFSIKEKYGTQAALEITAISIADEVVTLTTAAQKAATLYEVTTATGISDAKGNVTTAALTTTFVGSGIASAITAVSTAVDTTGTDYKLTLTFDQSVGTGAFNVGSYVIDGSIGYPTSAAAVTGAPTKVELTLSKKTVTGTLYKITVKNVANADGVAMAAAGITKNFVGTGGATVASPKLQAAVAVDDQTVKLYFDTKITSIAGLDRTSAMTLAAEINFTGANDPTHAFIDPTNDMVIIAYTTVANGFETTVVADTTVAVDIAAAGLDADYDSTVLAENTTAPTAIKVDGVVATSANTLTVYFNQPVRLLAATADDDNTNEFAYVEVNGTAGYTVADAEIEQTRALNTELTQYEVRLDKSLANQSYSLVLDPAAANTEISTLISGASHVAMSTATSATFAGNASLTAYISNVYAVATDARTLVVYYPEAMNATDVTTLAMYDILTDADADVIKATYDSSLNTATLILDADIDTAQDSLVIDKDVVKNAIGNKVVETSGDVAVSVVFAKNATAPAKVTVASASRTGAVITVTFSEELKTTANVTTAADVVALLNLTINDGTAVAAGDISAVGRLDAADGAVADSSATFTKKITITLTPVLTANKQATVNINGAASITGIKGQAGLAGQVIFVQ